MKISINWNTILFHLASLCIIFCRENKSGTSIHHHSYHHNFGHRNEVNILDKRCRSFDDFENIPWLRKNSTFYNLGFPLLRSLCPPHFNNHRKSDRREFDNACQKMSLEKMSSKYSNAISNATKFGPYTSTILVDPPFIDDGSATSGVFTMNAVFAILYKLGYNVRIRNWSPGLSPLFPVSVVSVAMNSSNRWQSFITGESKTNPFADVGDHISFQGSVGINSYMKPQLEITSNPFVRDFRWILGLHHKASHEHYQSDRYHCIGANFFLGEGLQCSSSSVIACPMFPFHLKESSSSVNRQDRVSLKENIVLLDSDAKEFDAAKMQRDLRSKGIQDVWVILHTGRKREDVPKLYKSVKVTLDCRNPGVEFINYEATLYDCLTLSCNSRATKNMFDFPIPSKYHIEPTNYNETIDLIYSLLVNYTQHIDDFKTFRKLSRTSQSYVETQLDLHLFSRDVLFRTFCKNYAECRCVLPWALSVWVLYPLVRIEVYVNIDVKQFLMDNDIILNMFSKLFNDRYWIVKDWNDDGTFMYTTPVNILPSFPCKYILYMDPKFVLFGRDFVNDHIKALSNEVEEDNRPISYFDKNNKLVISFMKYQPPPADLICISYVREPSIYILYKNKKFRASYETFYNLANYGMKIKHVTKKELQDVTEDESMPTSKSMALINRNILYTSSEINNSSRHGELAIDAIYFPDAKSADLSEFWLSSSSPRLNVKTFLRRATHAEKEILVRHLDHIIQSSFYLKAMGSFPEHIQTVLSKFNAIHYPNVISIVDSKHQNWASEECKNNRFFNILYLLLNSITLFNL